MASGCETHYDALEIFVKTGASIISTNSAKRYGHAYAHALCQPGFIPLSGPPKICWIGITPSSNWNGDVDVHGERERYLQWAREGNLETYEAAYRLWLQNVRHWPAAANARKLLAATGLELTDLAWLNLCKVPDTGSISTDLATRDFPVLKRQLALLGPEVLVVLGTTASAYDFAARWLRTQYGGRFGQRGQRGGPGSDSIDALADRYASSSGVA